MEKLATERAAAGKPPIAIELHRVPFFLEPWYVDQPDDWWETHTERMVRKFGSQEAFDSVKLAHQLMPRAKEAGLDQEGWTDANLDRRRQSSTLRAHRLIRWLDATLGWEAAELAYAHLHTGHFVEGELLNDVALLTQAAVAAGADAAATESFLHSTEHEATILMLVAQVHALGIHSIPTLCINGEPTLSGAAGAAEVLQAFRQATANSSNGRCRFIGS